MTNLCVVGYNKKAGDKFNYRQWCAYIGKNGGHELMSQKCTARKYPVTGFVDVVGFGQQTCLKKFNGGCGPKGECCEVQGTNGIACSGNYPIVN